jgi:hypothetical protein
VSVPVLNDADFVSVLRSKPKGIACGGSDPALDLKARVDTAREILKRWGISGVRPEDVIAADRFWKHLKERFPTGRVYREVSVHAYDGLQVISGRIDLLIEGSKPAVLRDPERAHKADALRDDEPALHRTIPPTRRRPLRRGHRR